MTVLRLISRPALAICVLVALAACQNVPMLPGLTPYRMDIQQGNVVTDEMVSKLKPGMTRQQVRFVMGTPPIVDAFHPDRWDYVYYVSKAGKITEHRRLVLRFEGDILKRVDGDVTPTAEDSKAAKKTATEPAAEEKGFFGRMLDNIGF